MTRLDWFLLGLGPLMILLIWTLLPGGAPEGSRAAEGPSTGVVAELVGYTIEPGQGSVGLGSVGLGSATGASTRPWVLGSGSEADIRLHKAPMARRAAVLLPPEDAGHSWAIMPVQAGLTLRRVGGDPAAETDRLRETSWRPWPKSSKWPLADPPASMHLGCSDSQATMTPVLLRQLRLWGTKKAALEESEILWLETEQRAEASGTETGVDVVSCPNGPAWWRAQESTPATDPCGAKSADWKRVRKCTLGRPAVCEEPFNKTWGVRVEQESGSQLYTPWGEPFRGHGVSLSLGSGDLRSFRLGLKPAVLDAECQASNCQPTAVEICPAGDDKPVETLGALELLDGDLLRVGRTRFLVRTRERAALELLHVRNPRAPGYFRTSSGHDVYHPNRRGMWPVPSCDAADEALTILVQPGDQDSSDQIQSAELTEHDRALLKQIDAGAQHRGIPHEVPPVIAKNIEERALVTLCASHDEEGMISANLSLGAPRRGMHVQTSAQGTMTTYREQEDVRVELGSAGDPREVLIEMDGNLIRVAPTASGRVTQQLRRGLAFYLIFVLVLQAVPLTLARQSLRRRQQDIWPANLGASTLQQLAGVGITTLLFIGASFQFFLAAHPDLAGKPDYAQAFLQGVIVVSVALAAAAGFAHGPGQHLAWRPSLPTRLASAGVAASLTLLGAGFWWWIDGKAQPEGLWLKMLRDQATASSGAGPEAFGQLLFQGAGAGLGFSLVLYFSAKLPWAGMVEWIARRALRLPILGFAALAVGGLALGIVQGSALAFELGILAGLAWYAGVYWAFVRQGRSSGKDGLQRRAALRSLASGLLMLMFLVIFFVVGADLPDSLSFASVALGLAITAWTIKIIVVQRFTSLLRVLLLWAMASFFGVVFASVILTDMGSIAAWLPAVLTGLFLWLVRIEEQGGRDEDPQKATAHLLLALGLGLVLLGVLDVFKTTVQGIELQALDRPRQRLDLAEDVSYITAGEWITQVRWLASHQDGDFQWVPNVNSDIAIFGLSSGVGTWLAILASMLVLGIAGCAGLAADQALRQGHAASTRSHNDRLYPALHRALGLLMGMISVLLICQWLVHLATGVVLHLPITGLVFPWISHGNTTHLLYAAAIVFPMAAITALGLREEPSR